MAASLLCSVTTTGCEAHAGFGTDELSSRIETTQACPLQSLVSHGMRTIAGLQVAFLNVADKAVADQLIEEINMADGDIDLLITSDWPSHVTELATAPSGDFCVVFITLHGLGILGKTS